MQETAETKKLENFSKIVLPAIAFLVVVQITLR